ncbi:MAG: PAS domain S-box protein [Candidatus Cloacimonetes bacterium]|nr:PAS domain S-box protein [Candidatus Cloacimonadota bacterium]
MNKLQNSNLQAEKLRSAYQELESLRSKFTAFFEKAPVGFLLLNQRGMVIEVNETLCQKLNYDKSEMVDVPITGFIYHEDQEHFLQNYKPLFKNPAARELQVRLLKRGDERLPVELIGIKENNLSELLKYEQQDILLLATIDISQQQEIEIARKAAEQKLRILFNQTAVGIAEMGIDGSFIKVNKRLSEITGYSVEELEKINSHDITYPDDISFQDKLIAELLRSERDSFELEKRYIHQNGKIEWVRLYSTIVRDRFGNPLYFIITVVDVNDLKEAEQIMQTDSEKIASQNEALREKEMRYRLLSEVSFEGILLHENGKVIDANSSLLRMTGFDQEDVEGFNLLDIIPKESDRQQVMEKFSKSYVEPYRITLRRKDGSEFLAEIEARNMDYNGKHFRIGAVRDVSEKAKTEEALAFTEQKYRTYIENAPNGFFVADGEGRYLEVNTAACRITGYTEKELLQMKISDLVLSEDLEKAGEHFQSLNDEAFRTIDIRFLHKNKSVRFWNIIARKIAENRYIAFTQDITERVQNEKDKFESERLLDAVGNIALVGGWEMNLETGKAKWTRETYNIVEIDYNEAIPGLDEHVEFYLPQYREMIQEKMKALIEKGIELEFEAELKTSKGNIKWCKASGRREMVNDKCIKLYGTFQDINSRKAIELELAKHREHLEEIVKKRTQKLEEQKAELENFNRLFVGREFRIKELREKVKELEKRLAQEST